MSNRFFIFSLIFSISFHYWLFNGLPDIWSSWKYPDEKKEIVFSVSIKEHTPEPSPPPINKNTYQKLDKIITSQEVLIKEEEMVVQADPSPDPESIKREKQNNISDDLSKIEKTEEGQLSPSKDNSIIKNSTVSSENPNPEIEDGLKIIDTIITKNNAEKDSENYKKALNPDLSLLNENREASLIQEDFPLNLTGINHLNNEVTMPQVITYHPPEYPNNLRKRNIEGQVLLKVLVDKKGVVSEIFTDSTSGYQGFDQASIEAILRWKFDPAKYDGVAKDSWVLIPVVFKLK